MNRVQSRPELWRIRNIQFNDSPSVDAFGRLRVSNPETIFDSKQIFDNQPLFWDDQETSGGGTSSSHSTDTASTTISVSATTAGKRVRQTFQRFNYQPGKSFLIIMTAKMTMPTSGITADVGYFDDNNGIFFQSKGTTINVVRRTYTSGASVDNTVAQSDWNVDRMDGTGQSGVSIDPTMTQILFMDMEWLGVGRVRMGFIVDGLFHVCHEFLNTNALSTVYMSTPNLPIRYQIENDGSGAATSLTHICSSVIIEGGAQETGTKRYASTAGTHVSCTTENVIYAIIGIRLKSAYIGTVINILKKELQLQTASHKIEWTLRLNPTVGGTFTYGDQTNSAVQIATGASTNTVTGGTIIDGGFAESGGVAAGGAGSSSAQIKNILKLGSKIDGTLDTIVLCAMPIGGASAVSVEGGITWRELS